MTVDPRLELSETPSPEESVIVVVPPLKLEPDVRPAYQMPWVALFVELRFANVALTKSPLPVPMMSMAG